MEVYYRADSSNSIIWHLRARSVANGGSATYPWEFVGGGALYTAIGNTEGQTNGIASGVFAALGVNGGATISLTVPLIGTYIVEGGGAFYTNVGSNTNTNLYMGFKANGTLPTFDDAGYTQETTQNRAPINWTSKLTVTSSGNLVVEQVVRQDGGTRNLYGTNRFMKITPIRVG